MLVLFVCFGPALLAGIITWVVLTKWPGHPVAPWLDDSSTTAVARRHPNAFRWLRQNPEMTTGSLLVALGAVAAAGAVVIGLLFEMVRLHWGFASFDGSAARFGATHATSFSTSILRTVTQLGGALLLVPVAIVVAFTETRRHRSWASVAFLAVVVGGQYILANLIKVIVGRARPNLLRLAGFSGRSFPSGHATAAAATFAAFVLLLGRGRSRSTRMLLAAASMGLVVLIAATRVLLGVHWLTDVLAGMCLGWTWFAVTAMAFGGRRLRFGTPVIASGSAIDNGAVAPAPRLGDRRFDSPPEGVLANEGRGISAQASRSSQPVPRPEQKPPT